MGNGELRIERDGFFQVGHRLGGPFQFIESCPQIGQGLNEIGINLDSIFK